MWRAIFLALGITSVIVGAECAVVEKVLLAEKSSAAPVAATGFEPAPNFASNKVKELVVPDWAPWSLVSGGVIVILYCFTIPNRGKGG